MRQHFVILFLLLLATRVGTAQDNPANDTFIAFDVEPAITTRVSPAYPKEALTRGLEGMVWLKVFISEKGLPEKIEVVKSTDRLFEQSAIDAARQFRFTAGQIKGKPVAGWVSIPFKFKLSPKTDIIRKNSEEIPKKIKSPTVLIVEGPRDLEGTIVYPPGAVSDRIEGAVFASVLLNNERRITEIKITKRLGGGCDEEVLRAISAYRFYKDDTLELTTQGDQSIASVVVQFILPARAPR